MSLISSFHDQKQLTNISIFIMYYVDEDAHMNVDEGSQWLRRGELNERTKYPDGNMCVQGAYPLIFGIICLDILSCFLFRSLVNWSV
jgi:hypothetical protein